MLPAFCGRRCATLAIAGNTGVHDMPAVAVTLAKDPTMTKDFEGF
jgi:hypothetical protein